MMVTMPTEFLPVLCQWDAWADQWCRRVWG